MDAQTQEYTEFLIQKAFVAKPSGFSIERNELHPTLFEFQKDIVGWALKRGKAAIFAGTGLGKTFMQCEWSKHVSSHTNGRVLILAPLAVATQTAREAEKIDLNVHVCQDDFDVCDGVNITNYDKLHKFDLTQFTGVVLDESSLLKSYDGKMRNMIIDSFKQTPYKLACTATPAPNDYMELGNHSEFLGVMSRSEMLAMFFIHDGGDTSKWRLKGHAQEKYWEWVSSWSVMIRKPSDLGYDDGDFQLPPLNVVERLVRVDHPTAGYLIPIEAQTLLERQQARRSTIEERVAECAEILNASNEQFLVWCDLNKESDLLTRSIVGAVEVKGSDKPEYKEKSMLDFADGKIRVLVTKPSIAGFGMNWQQCNNMAFVGLSDSFEQIYQAIRRCYRFGQTKHVNVYMVTSELEGAVTENIKRKESDFERMQDEMSKFTQNIVRENIQSASVQKTTYRPMKSMIIPNWLMEESA